MAVTKSKEEKPIDDVLQKNMRFYSRVMTTPKEAQKSFNNGSFQGTDINPMYRIQKLTEIFGPVGFGWWTQNVHYDFVEADTTKEVAVFCDLELVIKDPETGEISQPIYGIGGNAFIKKYSNSTKISDEAKKMAYTDALSIACKAIGIGHDIWYQNDKTKYTMDSIPAVEKKPESKQETKAEEVEEPESLDTVIKKIDATVKKLTAKMTDTQKTELGQQIKKKIGVVNYRKCEDVAALTGLLKDLEKAA